MPISRKDFEKGKGKALDTDEEKVVTFFEKNKDNAYTIFEIAEAVGLPEPYTAKWLVHILQKLEKEGRTERKEIDDKDYWILVT
ncbi:MAG: hypothetical protein N2V78_03855 [Methanophagales archaeon]|nr:hypothetical protein [Methanophagales archaeon]